MPLLSGAVVHHYQVQSLLRSSALFDAYQAVNLQTGEEVIFQVLLPGRATTYSYVESLRAQADLLMRLDHPNLAPLLDAGECESGFYLVTRLPPGQPLADLESMVMPVRRAAALLAQAADALEYLHQQKVTHGMLSPEFLWLGEDGGVLLLNAGLASILQREVTQSLPDTMVGVGIGDPYYLAPEQVLGRSPTPAADQYALGAIFYTLLTGRKPHESDSPIETALQKTVKPLTWTQPLPRQIPYGAVQLVHRCLSRQPEDRFKQTGEVHAALRRLASGRRVTIRLKRHQWKGLPRRSYTGLRVGLTAAILLLLGGFLVYRQWLGSDTGVPPAAVAAETRVVLTPNASPTPAPPQTVTPSPEGAAAPEPPAAETPTPAGPSNPAETPAPTADQPRLIFTPLAATLPPIDPAANLEQLREVYRLGLGRWMQYTWAGDGTQAVASSAGVFLVKEDRLFRFIDPGGWATSVKFSLDGTLLAVGMLNGDIQLWDWANGAQVKVLRGHQGRVTRILFSSNRLHLISASEDLNIKVWDIAKGTEFKNIPAHQLPVEDIAISQDGRVLISGARDFWVKVWDIASGRKEYEFNHGGPVSVVAISPDGTWVASGGSGWVRQWSLISRQLRTDSIPFDGGIIGLYYDDDASDVYIQVNSGRVHSVSATQRRYNRTRGSLLDENKLSAFNLAFGPVWRGAETVNVSDVSMTQSYFPGLVWEERTMNKLYERFDRLYFSPNSQYMLATGQNGLAYVWESQRNGVIKLAYARVPPGNPFSQDSQKFVLLGREVVVPARRGSSAKEVDTLQVYESATGNPLVQLLDVPQRAAVRFVHNDTLVLASNGVQARLWDLSSGLEAAVKSGNEFGCLVSRSQNDNLVLGVYTTFGILPEWNERVEYLCSLGTRFAAGPAAIRADQGRVAYINANGLLEMVNMDARRTAWSQLPGFTITSLGFSPDGRLLAAGAPDGSLTFWDADTGARLWSTPGHFDRLNQLVFAPNGSMIASGSNDGTVRIWGVIPEGE